MQTDHAHELIPTYSKCIQDLFTGCNVTPKAKQHNCDIQPLFMKFHIEHIRLQSQMQTNSCINTQTNRTPVIIITIIIIVTRKSKNWFSLPSASSTPAIMRQLHVTVVPKCLLPVIMVIPE